MLFKFTHALHKLYQLETLTFRVYTFGISWKSAEIKLISQRFMIFQYSSKQLLTIFLRRFLPSLLFLVLALLLGKVFWIATILLWVEAIVETLILRKKGYVKIEETQIEKHNLLITDRLKFDEVSQGAAYGDEWTFSPAHNRFEIKIFKSKVKASQQKQLNEQLHLFWKKAREHQAGR